MRTTRKLWIGLGALIVLSPLGLILPARFGAGTAWGEWSAEELRKLVGYVPKGMSAGWNAPLPDYVARGRENAPCAFSGLVVHRIGGDRSGVGCRGYYIDRKGIGSP